MNVPKWLGIELVEVSIYEKFIATIGGGASTLALILFSCWALPVADAAAIITSMGASAVLLFAAPHGQLSQPWPVLAGHGFSAIIGVACAQWIPHPTVAAACAVGLSIGVMVQLKCIHPPGGATAFAAVMGGPAIRELGFAFVLFPVVTNALVMLVLAILISAPFAWRRYPASLARLPRQEVAFPAPPHATHDEIITAVRSLDSFVDVSEEDLAYLIDLVAQRHATATSPEINASPVSLPAATLPSQAVSMDSVG